MQVKASRVALTLVALLPVALTFHACSLRKKLQPERDVERSGDARRVGPGGAPWMSEDELKTTEDVVGYARYCKQELGLAAAPLSPWNCLDGTEIPVTVEGKPLDEATYQKLKDHKVGCDVAAWLGEEPCANYAFVQKRQLAPDVDAYLLCRMRSFSTYKDRAGRLADLKANGTPDNFNAYYAFDSLGIIWTSPKTGKTCYFDYIGKVYGGYVASPDDEHTPSFEELPDPKPPAEMAAGTANEFIWKKNGRATWRSPKEVVEADNCIRCHDTGALKGSPWIMQAFDIKPNDPGTPYQVIGKAFDGWKKRFPVRAVSTAPIKRPDGTEEPQICTACHRIGSEASCEEHMTMAIGGSTGFKPSTLGSTFFYRTWMPPSPTSWHGKTEAELTALWHDAYQAHVDRLKCCCKDHGAKNCFAQDITQSPLPAPVAGTGPAVCP